MPRLLLHLRNVGWFVLMRAVLLAVVLFVVATVVFFMLRTIPGGPFALVGDRELPRAIKEAIEARYHLNDPLLTQYRDYMVNLLHFDLGPSMTIEGMTVNQLIAEKFPRSALLGFFSVSLAIIIGVPVGIIAAQWRNRWPDKLSMGMAIVGVSVPSFVLAALLLLAFVLNLRWFRSVGYPVSGTLWQQMEYIVLPGFALTGFSLAYITRLLRSSMLEVLSMDFIRTAEAKGLSLWIILVKHSLKNALLPVLTYLGPLIAGTFTGSFVIETIFSFPGLGRYFVISITNRDFTVVLGVTLFYCAFLTVMNMIVEVLYTFLDPRIET
jgi:oligopeptide transport system permease protein